MKKILIFAVLTAAIAVIAGCSADDPLTELENYGGSNPWNNGGNTSGGNGSSTITSELATFDVSFDVVSAEPAETAAEYFPD